MDGERPGAERGGDVRTERLAQLFDAHFDRLLRIARRMVANADDALDLVQDVFLRAARAIESIPHAPPQSEAWLVRVLINVRRDAWRREAVRRRLAPILRVDQDQATHTDQETDFVTRTTVWRALDTLPPRRRAVVVMSELEGLSTQAIAALLGINTVTVRWHLSRGRRELARQLRSTTGADHEGSRASLAAGRPASSRTRSL